MMDQHFKCWLWKILWSFGLLSLVLAWFSLGSGAIAGLETGVWFWNALVAGILATPIKLDCHNCRTCNPQG